MYITINKNPYVLKYKQNTTTGTLTEEVCQWDNYLKSMLRYVKVHKRKEKFIFTFCKICHSDMREERKIIELLYD